MNRSQVLASAVALTTSATASTRTANVNGTLYHTLMINWTPGTTGNVLTVSVEYSLDDVQTADASSTWFQEMGWSLSSGHYTRTLIDVQHTAASTTAVPLIYPVADGEAVNAKKIRIKYAESEAGGATKGTITAQLFSHA